MNSETHQVGAKSGARLLRFNVSNWPLGILAALAVVYALKSAKPIVIIVLTAFFLWLLVKPLLRFFENLGMSAKAISPALLAASIVLTIAVCDLAYQPTLDFLSGIPKNVENLNQNMQQWRRSFRAVGETAAQLEKMAEVDLAGKKVDLILTKEQSLLEKLLSSSHDFLSSLLAIAVLHYLLCLYGDDLIRSMSKLHAGSRSSDQTEKLIQELEVSVSQYLLTITSINLLLGLVVMTYLYIIGMPNAIAWGVAAAVLNFIPYVGTLVTGLFLGISSFLYFDFPFALAAPGGFYILTSLEGMLITPAIIGKKFVINPIVVFTFLIFSTWMWGIVGALLSGPSLVIAKIVFTKWNSQNVPEIVSAQEHRTESQRVSVKLDSDVLAVNPSA